MASAGMAPAASVERTQQLNERSAVSKMVAAGQTRSGARWFYWIAGLSLINSAIVVTGGSVHFMIGLGITSVVDAAVKRIGSAGLMIDAALNGCIAGVLIMFGAFASKARKWAFIFGMALYTADGVLVLSARDYFGAGFHAYALWAIYRGYAAAQQMQW
jgi:hypothetical protein